MKEQNTEGCRMAGKVKVNKVSVYHDGKRTV
jgi:hypothetical protein